MKLAAAHLTLAHCALALREQGVVGPRLDLFIPASDAPGTPELVACFTLSNCPKQPAIYSTLWAVRGLRRKQLGAAICLN